MDEWAIDVAAEQRADGFPGMEVERDQARGCVGVLGGPATPGGAGDRWYAGAGAVRAHRRASRGPVAVACGGSVRARVEDGTAIGRGACDMKGGLAAVLGAVSAITASGAALLRPLAVHAVSAEEDGGLGAFATLRRGHRASACVIAEPTDGAVVPANGGSLTFRISIEGRATHGSTRTRGVSAVDLLRPVQDALAELEAERNAAVGALLAPGPGVAAVDRGRACR